MATSPTILRLVKFRNRHDPNHYGPKCHPTPVNPTKDLLIYLSNMVPKTGVPLNHPFLEGFSIQTDSNHPFLRHPYGKPPRSTLGTTGVAGGTTLVVVVVVGAAGAAVLSEHHQPKWEIPKTCLVLVNARELNFRFTPGSIRVLPSSGKWKHKLTPQVHRFDPLGVSQTLPQTAASVTFRGCRPDT